MLCHMRSQEAGALGRNNQLVRALEILHDLDRLGGVDLYELAERHGTAVRTIRRDLEALEQAGIPLTCEADGKRKRWRINFGSHRDKLSRLLDAGHYLALCVAMRQGGAVQSSSAIFATLEDLANRVEDALGPKGRAQLAAIETAFASRDKRTYRRSPPDVFWPLVHAIAQRRMCTVTYRAGAASRDRKHRVHPLRLLCHEGAVYLLAYLPRHRSIITFNLQRLRKLEVLDVRAPPRRFDLERWEESTFGIVGGGRPTTYRLRFVAGAAPFIRERRWHPTEKLRDLPDGALELSFRCNESWEVDAWVASWRGLVEVVEPTRLRKDLLDYGRWLLRQYA